MSSQLKKHKLFIVVYSLINSLHVYWIYIIKHTGLLMKIVGEIFNGCKTKCT